GTPHKNDTPDYAYCSRCRVRVRRAQEKGRENGKWNGRLERAWVGIDGESRNGEYYLLQSSIDKPIIAHPLTIHTPGVLEMLTRKMVGDKRAVNLFYGSFFDW